MGEVDLLIMSFQGWLIFFVILIEFLILFLSQKEFLHFFLIFFNFYERIPCGAIFSLGDNFTEL